MIFLAIDIGNTNITAGVFHNSKINKVIRINTSDPAKQSLSYFNSLKINEIIISSVVPKKTEDYINLFKTQINITPKIVDYNHLKFLKLSVDNPKSVGADRICNIISANKIYNGAKIIIDFGTATTFDVTIPSLGGTITGNVAVTLPIDFCFYLVSTGTVTNINQFFPLFTQSIPQVSENQILSTTLTEKLPLINHPTVQSGALNFAGSNNEIAPKQRGLMLRRGQALYVAASGATALTNGFYCNIQGGFY